jgi:hypothetical protein
LASADGTFGLLATYLERALHGSDQPLHVLVEIPPGVDFCSIAEREILQGVRQFRWLGHLCAAYQDRNDGTPILERRLNLDANGVGFFRDAQSSALGLAQPFGADHGNKDVVLRERLLDVLAKIHPEGDTVDIHKNGSFAEMVGKLVSNAPCDGI